MSQEATIRRGVRNARYAAIPNHVFEDTRLSMEARWLLSYLLSKPDNWTVVIGDIIKKGNCGRDKARKMIAELVDLGYAEREQIRDDGKFGSSILVIYDEPSIGIHSENQASGEGVAFLPQTCLPATAEPSPVLPAPVISAPSNYSDLTNTENQKREGVREAEIDRSATPGTSEFRKRVQCFLSGVGYRAGEWPNWAKATTIDYINRHFAALPEAERRIAEGDRDCFLAKCARDGGSVMGAGNYFRDRAWEALSERDRALTPQKGTGAPSLHKAFSRAWQGLAIAELLGPEKPLPRMPAALEQLVLAGGPVADRERRQYRTRWAWPEVYQRYANPKPVAVPPEIIDASQDFKSCGIKEHASIIAGWKRLYEARGWPWPEMGNAEWICFPASDGDSDEAIEAALDEFRNSISKGQGHDHAA